MRNLITRIVAIATVVATLALAAQPARAIERQRATNWCWAAAINDVISVAGGYRSQEQIAADLDGWPRDRPATLDEVVALFRAYGFRSWVVPRPGTPDELYGTLRNGYAIVAFIRPTPGPVGHYVVVKGFDAQGNLLIGDPAFGTEAMVPPAFLYQVWAAGVVVGR